MCNERSATGRSAAGGRRRDDDVVIIDGLRTPFCKAGTALASLAADELGRQVVDALLMKTGLDSSQIDEVIFGCVSQPADASNVARVLALRAGIPERVPAVTLSRNCASGMEAVVEAWLRIRAGRGDLFLVGGTESMSQVPYYFEPEASGKITAVAKARHLYGKVEALRRLHFSELVPTAGLAAGLQDPVSGMSMGETAELLAREYQISREAQDAFALRSHERATAGRTAMTEEIAPVYVHHPGGGTEVVTYDNGPRSAQTREALANLRPVFDPVLGTVTAGNASMISDGAVALLVASRKRAEELGLGILGCVADFALIGCEPERMGLGPLFAMRELEGRGYPVQRADLIEINEAFAAQVLAVLEEYPLPQAERLNVNGGAIALGHPVGATGARLALTTLLELRRRGERSAVAALCVGGGQGMALWLTHDPQS